MRRFRHRVLLTGGRAPATLELARAFSDGGCEVFLAESVPYTLTAFSNAVTRSYRVPSPRHEHERFAWRILDIVRAEAIDVVVGTCEEVFQLARAEPVVGPHVALFSPSLADLRRLHHKAEFVEWAAELGLDVPRTEVVTSRAALVERIRADGKALVFKPCFSRFSSHARVGPTRWAWTADVDISEARPWAVQERMAGARFCSWTVVRNGQIRAHTTYPMDWCEGTGAALRWTHVEVPSIRAWVETFCAKTGLTGQLAFDWFVDGERAVPIECNPRLTSGVHVFGPDAGGLAEAFFGEGAEQRPVAGRPHGLRLAMLLYGRAELRERGLGEALGEVLEARDTLWRLTDPLPLLFHWVAYVVFLWWSVKHRITAMEASTWDIEWNGE